MVQAGLAFTVSSAGFGPLLQGIADSLTGDGIPVDDKLIPKINQSIPGTATSLDEVNLTGGRGRDFKGTIQSVTQKGPNVLDVAMNASFMVHYDHWNETWWRQDKNGTPHLLGPADAGSWEVGIEQLALTFELHVATTAPDPFDPSRSYWAFSIQNAAQGSVTPSDVTAPPRSVLSGDDWIACIRDRIRQHLKEVIATQDFATPLQQAINSRFATMPDSGKLTDAVIYCFPPMALAWPEGGGMQAAISGRVIYQDPATGTKTFYQPPPPDITLPLPPAERHFSVTVPPYEVNALLWAAQRSGVFSKTYSAQTTGDPTKYNTAHYATTLPALSEWAHQQLGGDGAFSIAAQSASPSGTGDPTPAVTIQTSWQVTDQVLDTIGAPADVRDNLAGDTLNVLFTTKEDLDTVLRQDLTADQYQRWAGPIEVAAELDSLVCVTGVSVDLQMRVHGAQTDVVKGLLQLTLRGADLEVADADQPGQQVLAFDLEVANYALANVVTADGLTIPQGDYPKWYDSLFGPTVVADALAALKPPENERTRATRHALPIPQLQGFHLVNTTIAIDGKQGIITVTGDNDPTESLTGRRGGWHSSPPPRRKRPIWAGRPTRPLNPKGRLHPKVREPHHPRSTHT